MSFSTKQIKSNTLGDLLSRTRYSRGWELKDVEKKTGISVNTLKILEANDFYKLSSPAHARGSLQRYSEFLNLDSTEIIKRFKQECIQSLSSSSDSRLSRKQTRPHKLALGSRVSKILVVAVVILLILFYLTVSIKRAVLTPQIEIIAPSEDLITKESGLIIKGKTGRGVDIFINNQAVGQINNGYFEQKIELLPGLNVVEISGKKKYSKKATVYRRVVLEESLKH